MNVKLECIKIAEYFGILSQKEKAIEEMSELIQAICKKDKTSILEEVADVEIMLEQIKHLYILDSKYIEEKKIEKIERLYKRNPEIKKRGNNES